MADRIGALHLNYRVRGVGGLSAALVPRLDRAIQLGAGAALEQRFAAELGADPAVTVIRELNTDITLAPSDVVLDRRIVDKFSRASIDAVVTRLRETDSTDHVMRFADQAEFVGSFILELLNGTAWDRWYYGAFNRYRRADPAGTIRSVLDDNRLCAAAVFGWLARRGRLEHVLALLGPDDARRLASPEEAVSEDAHRNRDVAPLVRAAFELLDALGWVVAAGDAREQMAVEYLRGLPVPATWSDRRSPTAWILGFIKFVVDRQVRDGISRGAADLAALRALLTGPLDWLDVSWLEPRLAEIDRGTAAPLPASSSTASVLTHRHQQLLERLASLLQRSRFKLDPSASRDAAVVRLAAALAEAERSTTPLDRAIMAVIERVAEAWYGAVHGGYSRDLGGALRVGLAAAPTTALLPPHLLAHVENVRAAGPAAVRILQQLVSTTPAAANAVTTSGAPLYLLTRALLDIGLEALSAAARVPFEPLRATLAHQWLRLTPPFDAPTAAWVGAEQPAVNELDLAASELHLLQQAVFERLHGQRALHDLPGDEELADDAGRAIADFGCSPHTAVAAARIAAMVFRGWSRWLPGIGGGTTPFIVRNSLERTGRVSLTGSEIAVQLDPAPFDIVLEMAGYYGTIAPVSWLQHRRVTFSIHRQRLA
jgi:hypothetical protein